MKTQGGGWTLVYRYTFTNDSSFDAANNAVTPRPNWSTYGNNVPISITPPLGESSLSALVWNEFMVKSTVNDCIVCHSGIVECIAAACSGVAPDNVK